MNQLSEHETETLLREGLERLAERAPDGHDVRNALARARQGRRSRPRLALAAVAAAVILVLAGVPVALDSLSGDRVTAAAGRPVVSFTPGWLPDGFTEQYRSSGPGSTPQVRRWLAGEGRITLSAHSTADPEWSQTALRIAALPDQVVIDGRVGMVTGDTGTAALLTWMADAQHVLTVDVEAVPGARWAAQEIAGSVTTDEPVRVRGEARFGPLPGGLQEFSTTVAGSAPGTGSTEFTASTPAAPRVAVLRVTAGAGSPGLGGTTPVPVRGVTGAYRAPAGPLDGMVAVALPSGHWLTVSGRQPRDELVSVADAVVLDPAPDYGWLGRG
ncbi:hypothetical protein [Amycolatopsis sp. PS_44_ISF1]|uniref:hypothetical protein n=1 Tax=Amycolatopsis sp. PS_44_ISF1 TaxID=2974917 RepID=UPI0028DFDB9D|nr:hypothetical protein [Amycolatopsis sp. PS_44_ISF1]MDT8914329.1 hypothetical protein [Amycolatopsis sp. PS_44_ISF1]